MRDRIRCAAKVWHSSILTHQPCKRYAVDEDGFCALHHPAAIAERERKKMERHAPPSAPTGDGMPTVSEQTIEYVRETVRLCESEGSDADYLNYHREVLALLDWATRRQEQGNG